jgi:hypothetical protein
VIIFCSVWFSYKKLIKLKLLFLKFKTEIGSNWLVLVWFDFYCSKIDKTKKQNYFCCLGTCSSLHDWILFKIIGVTNYNIIEKAIPYKISRKIKTGDELKWRGKEICSYYMSCIQMSFILVLNVLYWAKSLDVV